MCVCSETELCRSVCECRLSGHVEIWKNSSSQSLHAPSLKPNQSYRVNNNDNKRVISWNYRKGRGTQTDLEVNFGSLCLCLDTRVCKMFVSYGHPTNNNTLTIFKLLSLLISSQFWCGEWPICQLQSPGPPGLPRLRSGPPHQLPGTQSAQRVLPLPLWQWLWAVPQVHVTKLLHCLWTVRRQMQVSTVETMLHKFNLLWFLTETFHSYFIITPGWWDLTFLFLTNDIQLNCSASLNYFLGYL